MSAKVLVVDAQPEAWLELLGEARIGATTAQPDTALDVLARVRVDAVMVVLTSSQPSIMELLGRMAARHPSLPVVVLAAADALDENQANSAGVALCALPTDADALATAIARAVALASTSQGEEPSDDLLGRSKTMDGLRGLLKRVAPGMTTVLVRGESGTGKELVARAIHRQSERAGERFVKIHCAAIPDTLLESEVFGYEKGAFTGAAARKPGLVERAQGGTLFLDEIGDVTPAFQVKLLRLLQDREFERLGGTETLKADVRFVAATHRDLESMVETGSFRQDLFYRLSVVPLWVPPLRARRGDASLLARYFCERFATQNKKRGLTLGDDALAAIDEQRWPGNVRQLQNLMERLVVLSEPGAHIGASALEHELRAGGPYATRAPTGADTRESLASEVIPLEAEVRKAERRALLRALRHADDNRSVAARMLGISRGTLYNKLREHGLD